MRESRADRLIPFLKVRFRNQLDISDTQKINKIKSIFNELQKSLSTFDAINLEREG